MQRTSTQSLVVVIANIAVVLDVVVVVDVVVEYSVGQILVSHSLVSQDSRSKARPRQY